MVDKEKQKVKKAREAAGEDADAESISPKVCWTKRIDIGPR